MIIRLICLLAIAVVAVNAQNNTRRRPNRINVRQRYRAQNETKDTEIVLAFAIFRHGDRTSDPEELKRYPAANLNASIFYPFNLKSLTNDGKQHAYKVGEYLRKRYNGFLSDLYLPEEISIRTTNFARTKMTVLAALAGLYPPNRVQRWNSNLNWQPIPYDTRPLKEDDLQPYSSCPAYVRIKNKVYDYPEIREILRKNEGFLKFLSEKTGYEVKSPNDVYFFSSLVQTLENVGVKLPQWVQEVRPKLKELTNLESTCGFYTTQQKRLAGGVVLGDFVSASKSIIAGDKSKPKVHLLSAHENSVAGLMAAVNVFSKPHHPNYGAVFSLELYRNKNTNKYGVMAVYAPEAGGPGTPIPIPDCGGHNLCDFDTFLNLTRPICMTREEFEAECHNYNL